MLMQPDQPVQTPPTIQTPMPTDQASSPLQSTSMSPVPTETSKKHSSMLKGLMVFVVVVLLLGIGYIGYQNYSANNLEKSIGSLQPTPVAIKPTPAEPTANWIERKFEKLGLTFKAPADLTMEESEESSG